MKNKISLLALVLTTTLLLQGCAPFGWLWAERTTYVDPSRPFTEQYPFKLDLPDIVPNGQGSTAQNSYDLEMRFDEPTNTLHVLESVSYYNATGATLDEVCFRLLPNANRDCVSFNAVSGDFELLTERQTIIRVALGAPLAPGDYGRISLDYQLRMPERVEKFGYKHGVYNFANAICYALVYKDGEWLTDAYRPSDDKGDAYYTQIADFDVSLTVPRDYVVAATSDLGDIDELANDADGTKTLKYDCEDVRDFTFSISKDYQVAERQAGDVTVKAYYLSDAAKSVPSMLEAAAQSIELFSEIYYPYPYEEYTLVLNSDYASTEFSSFVFCQVEGFGAVSSPDGQQWTWSIDNGEDIWAYNRLWATINAVHETAHQWFYIILGNDQIREPWIDEGGASISELFYIRKYLADSSVGQSWISTTEDNYRLVIQRYLDGSESGKVTGSLSSFDSFGYYIYVYESSAALYYELEQRLGNEQFDVALHNYFETYAYGEVTAGQFQQFWQSQTDQDLSSLFKAFIG